MFDLPTENLEEITCPQRGSPLDRKPDIKAGWRALVVSSYSTSKGFGRIDSVLSADFFGRESNFWAGKNFKVIYLRICTGKVY